MTIWHLSERLLERLEFAHIIQLYYCTSIAQKYKNNKKHIYIGARYRLINPVNLQNNPVRQDSSDTVIVKPDQGYPPAMLYFLTEEKSSGVSQGDSQGKHRLVPGR